MTTRTYRYHPVYEPIPRGWEMVSNMPGHHGTYSVLIRRTGFWQRIKGWFA